MLGQDLSLALENRGETVTGLARGDLDITDESAVRAALAEHGAASVVNCAAWMMWTGPKRTRTKR